MEAITTALSTGLTTISTNCMSVIGTIVPIALGVAGAIFVVKRATSWFKSLAMYDVKRSAAMVPGVTALRWVPGGNRGRPL